MKLAFRRICVLPYLNRINTRRQKASSYLLSMGYKKDIFAFFAYEFELLRCAKVPIVTVISYH